MSLPSLASLEILAVSDNTVFESVMQEIGLHVEGKISDDPLQSQVQNESVASIASELTENADEFVDVDNILSEYKKMAEDYGYIVSYAS